MGGESNGPDRRRRGDGRRDRSDRGGDQRAGGDRRLYDFRCDRCGAEDKVPFKPAPGRELLCRECMSRERNRSPGGGGGRRGPAPDAREIFQVKCTHCGAADTVPFEPFPGSVVLCRACMENPNVERVGGRILHSIICGGCGEVDRVPFKPDPGSRVLCRKCHQEEKEARQQARERFADKHPSSVHGTKVRLEVRCDRCGAEDTLPFIPRTSGPILCRQCAENTFGEDWAKRHRVAKCDYPFSCVRCGRQDFVPFQPKADHTLLCKRCFDDQVVMQHRDEARERVNPFICVRRSTKKEE